MSDAFKDREKGFERKYQLDQDQQFRAQARRDKLFGQWIASKLGHVGADAEAYAKAVIESNFEKPGDEDMLDKVRKDLSAKTITVSDHELHAKLTECQHAAVEQIATEGKK
jgi:hypothetical protein